MKKLSFFLVLLFLGNMNIPLQAQWQQTFGPFGWTAMHLASGDGFVYSSGGKIFRSSDNGMTWEEKSNGIWQWDADAIFVSNTRVFAGMFDGSGAGSGYLYYSDDHGESWVQHNTTGNSSPIVGFAKIGSNLFFATHRNGVFVSTNNGDSWTKTPGTGNPSPDINCIASLGSYLFFGAYNGLYRSSDNGNSWQFCNNPHFTIDGVYTIAVKGNTLYLTYGSGYSQNYRSSDNGDSFEFIGEGISYVYNFFSEGDNLYANTADGIFHSQDDGTNWTRLALAGETTYSTTFINGNLIVGTRNLGIFTSTNYGVDWINTGYRNELSPQAIVTLDNAILVGNDGQLGVLVSRDNGDTFTEYNNLSQSFVKSFAKRGTDIFAGTTPYIPQRGGVFKSTDAGLTWNFIGLQNKDIYSVLVKDNYLFAGSFYDGVFRTSNDGATWAQVSVGLDAYWIKTLIVYNNVLYAGTQTGLYSSSDNGNNWSLSAFQNLPVNSLEIVDEKLFAGTESGVYLLESSGTWTQVGLADNTIYCLKSLGSTLFAGGYPGLSFSNDYGSTWTSIKENIPSEMVITLDYNNTYLFAGTSLNGIWRRPLSEITAVSNNEYNFPKEYILQQNYPNPFNPSTEISWKSPISGRQTIKVYDILGKEVATLVDEFRAAGSYQVEFDATNLPSGIYIYRLNSNSFNESKKMILMK